MNLKLFALSVGAGIAIELIFQLLRFLDDESVQPPIPKYRPFNYYTSVEEYVANGRRHWWRYTVFRSLPPLGVMTLLAAIQQKHHIGGSLGLSLLIAATISLLPREFYKLNKSISNTYSLFTEQSANFMNIVLVYCITAVLYIMAREINFSSLSPSMSGVVDNLWSTLFVAILVAFYNVNGRVPNHNADWIEDTKLSNYVIKSYRQIEQKFSKVIDESCAQTNSSKALMYAVLIYENMNRPPFLRAVERLAVRISRKSLTIGIAQVRSNSAISDEESIKQASVLLANSKQKVIKAFNSTEQKYESVYSYTELYNSDPNYAKSIINVLSVLKQYAPSLFI